MAGDLHGDGLDAAFAHDGEQRLQVGGFGGGALGLDALVADAHLDGADETGAAHGLQAALDEVGGGGLAGGAGDADLEQVAAGPAVDRRRQFAHPSARVVDHEDRQAGRGGAFGAGRVGEHGGGAEAGGLGDEVGAVGAGPGQGGVQVAGAHGAGVMGDPRDSGGRVGRGGTQLVGQLREGCGGEPLRPGQSRVGHRMPLLGGSGLISVWHGGERTGRTRLRAKRGRGRTVVVGTGSDHGHGLDPGCSALNGGVGRAGTAVWPGVRGRRRPAGSRACRRSAGPGGSSGRTPSPACRWGRRSGRRSSCPRWRSGWRSTP